MKVNQIAQQDLRALLKWLHQIGGPNRLRFICALNDGLCCHYCRTPLNFENPRSVNAATYDHIIPKSQGGKKEEGNIVIACRVCNLRRGTKPYSEFMALVRGAANGN